MAKKCNIDPTPENLLGALRARGQMEGRSLSADANLLKGASIEQVQTYERVMAGYVAEKATEAKGRRDPITKESQTKLNAWGLRESILNKPHYPSHIVPEKAYNYLEGGLKQWYDTHFKDIQSDAARADYKRLVVAKAEALEQTINRAIENSATLDDLKAALAPKGLKPSDLKYLSNYTDWLKQGGRFYGKPDISDFARLSDNLAGNVAKFRIKWALGNVMEMYRPVAMYANNPQAISKGFLAAMKATKGRVWDRLPELRAKGVYGPHESEITIGKFKIPEPFGKTVDMQKNIVWHIDKAAGRDGWTGLRDSLYDPRPWDVPEWWRSEVGKHALGWMRYSVADGIAVSKLYRNGVVGTYKLATGDFKAGLPLVMPFLVYTAGKTMVSGIPSNIPAPLWHLMPEEAKDDNQMYQTFGDFGTKSFWRELDRSIPVTNLTQKTLGIDLTEYQQAFGGTLFAIGGMVKSTAIKTAESAGKAALAAGRGDWGESFAETLSFLLGASVFGPYKNYTGKDGLPYKQVELLNNKVTRLLYNHGTPFTVKDLYDVIKDAILQQQDPDETIDKLQEKTFGKTSTK